MPEQDMTSSDWQIQKTAKSQHDSPLTLKIAGWIFRLLAFGKG
jgi:hypothetical protein